jgi:hypothetical protein
MVVPSPSWPRLLSPQHSTAPLARTAQVWLAPAVTDTASSMPNTATGRVRWLVLASPSWPRALSPQHTTAPERRTAQVCVEPTATCVASSRPATSVGIGISGDSMPGPSWPLRLVPQHITRPLARTAQV